MIRALINKFLSLIVLIRYGRLSPLVRYYYRHTMYCKLVQLKYVFQDYIIKKPYKEISFSGEFAPDLQFVLPFAYWHFKNGTLAKTRMAKYTTQLYFFSPDHAEVTDTRTNEGNYNFENPRILFSQDYNIRKWAQVPLKDHYKNDIYVFDKPILVIANRYNKEWNGPPISFLSIEALDYIIKKTRDRYTIVYNRPAPKNITNDNSDVLDLNEFDWLRKTYPEVIHLEDLFQENRGNAKNFNHLQLMVYANADRFVSVHGGTATLASYFGGINLIFSKEGREHHFGCYQKLYPKFSGAQIYHAKTEEELKNYVDKIYTK
jgi:hypothetical protein